MTTAETASVVQQMCPVWCRGHHLTAADSAVGGETQVEHRSEPVRWSNAPGTVAWISQLDGLDRAGEPITTLNVSTRETGDPDVSSAEAAGRVIVLLERLADELERPGTP